MRITILATALAAAMTLVGCDLDRPQDEAKADQIEQAGENRADALEDKADEVRQATENQADAVEDGEAASTEAK